MYIYIEREIGLYELVAIVSSILCSRISLSNIDNDHSWLQPFVCDLFLKGFLERRLLASMQQIIVLTSSALAYQLSDVQVLYS